MKWGQAEDGVGRDATHRILGVFMHFSRGKVFMNKAIQRMEPGSLVVPHAAETASVVVGSCCHLLMQVKVTRFNWVLHRS